MAEAMAVVSLVMATYATIDLIIKHTDLLADGLASHHNLKSATQNLDDFRIKSANASLRQQLDLAHQLMKTSNDEEVKTNLSTSFEDIQKYIIQACDLLKERSTLNDWLQRPNKKLLTEQIGVALKTLKTARDQFESIANTAANQKAFDSLVLLNNDDFQVINKFDVSLPDQTSLVEAHLVQGGLTPSSRRGLFLLEERETLEANIRNLTEILALGRAQPTTSSSGVLNCMGYRNAEEGRQTGKFQLVFALPTNGVLDNTLQRLIQDCTQSPQSLPPSLNQRVDLCYQLSNAVLQVHQLNLVHKNINTINILAMKPAAPAPGAAAAQATAQAPPTPPEQDLTIFLADWRLVRKSSNASAFLREKDWWRRLYQHPSRHLIDIQQDYTMYHDIYSLGVCLIEILLWQSLLDKPDGQEPGPSPLLKTAVDEVIAGLGTPQTPGATGLASLDGDTIQDILIKIASTNLPPAVGTKLTALVVNCLKCLEGSFGPILFSGTSALATTLNFMTTIRADLWNFKLAL
jgi:Protein tyrosine and serine/threonine kinase